MNKLYVGFNKTVEPPTRGLFIHDEVPDLPRARIFDPAVHSFNPLKNMDYRQAADLVSIFMALFPGGENTLTKEGAQHYLLEALLAKPKSFEAMIEPSKDPAQEKARHMVERLLMSPVLRNVLCRPSNFSLKPNSLILARISRAELGEFDALVLGLFLIGHFKGQLAIPDFGFYGRDTHVSLIREDRLVAGVNHLGELPTKLRSAALLMEEKIPSGTNYPDAELLADYARIPRGTVGHTAFIDQAMA